MLDRLPISAYCTGEVAWHRDLANRGTVSHHQEDAMTTGRLATVGAALLLAIGFAQPITLARAADVDIMEQLKAAKPDHEAIASYYEKEAADAKAKAAMHRNMAQTYSGGTSIGKGLGAPLSQHCMNLVKDYDSAATQYTDMAKAHRDMAKAAK
jgi:hypothetical protein